ncbi:lipopolysaccharide biosynthesis protein [Paenibacillus sp. YYML68]|uniref:lipopolysaccharide biosynthesis protein n=1 Tax=Paenibacillus sp. YYML68 TaxID=2909250 RepID=UPI00248F89B7|nr:oligosaccharide flippase family protein [Paenibacillus sp. YYML68]
MSRESKLVKNTLIYIIGNITSKILAFFMLPVYTFYISQSDLGLFDIIYNVALIAVPILTLCSHASIFRFAVDESEQNAINKVISNGVFIVFTGIGLSIVPYMISLFFYRDDSGVYILGLIIIMALGTIWQQIARALHKNMVFAVSGVILTIAIFFSCMILILFFQLGLEALIFSYIFAYLTVFIYIEWRVRVFKRLMLHYIERSVLKKLLTYSLPLLPGEISWWLMSGVNRIIIALFIGAAANGVFFVASRFPNLLTMINGVFNLAWTESSIQEYNAEDKNEYYTKMFNLFMRLQISIFLLALPTLKYLMIVTVEQSYHDAWVYIPPLLLGTVFGSFSNFYSTGYLGSKKTMGAFITVMAASIVNVSLVLLLIPSIGLHAAGISNCVALIFLWIFRVFHTRTYFTIRLDYKLMFFLGIMIIFFMWGHYQNRIWIDVLLLSSALLISFIINKELLAALYQKVLQKYKKFKRSRSKGESKG